MAQWFEVRKADREVLRLNSGAVVPIDTPTLRFVTARPESIRRYRKAKRTVDDVSADGIPAVVLFSEGDFVSRRGLSWMSIDPITGRVQGTVRSSKARQPPPNDANGDYVAMSETLENTLRTLQEQAGAAGRPASEIRWDGTTLRLVPDTRPLYRVASNLTIVDKGATLTLTVSALTRATGLVDPSVTGLRVLVLAGRRLKLTFVSGVASRPLTALETGFIRFTSDSDLELEAPLSVEVVE